ncbi:MAG: tRNA (guanosine(37)-N1)-methyltransferase TrmD [Parachlamydiaceae bacterium]|nr:tRNA (guanosine(37)-N1)-methyltransferase TrmD [Parachlamydiaceae bacterium]
MLIHILSLFPGYFKGPFDESMIKQARNKGLLEIELIDIRDFADLPHRRVDDRPYGGGPGMVMMPKPVMDAVQHVKSEGAHVVYLSPQGKPLNAKKSRCLAQKPHLILLCGHYEGIDQRALDDVVDEEISIGDYVLTNGCLAAIVLVDSVVRFIPGVLGDELSSVEDSFEEEGGIPLLDCPHYTRPEDFKGKKVPAVLLSGNHREIEKWRREQKLKITAEKRPDLLKKN